MNNNNNIFSGLEHLGFKNVTNVDLYKKVSDKNEKVNKDTSEAVNETTYIYDRTITCPVCEHTFKARSVKKSGYKITTKDSDFFINYDLANPYFYDVWLCPSCGYAAMKSDFQKIKSSQKDLIFEKITSKWKGKDYGELYNVDIAIERYKLALLNSVVIEGKSSQKAMICLKIAWMYRILKNEKYETIFLKKALEGFNDAYYNERFPIYEMDKYTLMYLIGELYRRTYNTNDALLWFSNLITAPDAKQKLKELARNQKDLIKESQVDETTNEDLKKDSMNSEENINNNSKSFFSRFFNN